MLQHVHIYIMLMACKTAVSLLQTLAVSFEDVCGVWSN